MDKAITISLTPDEIVALRNAIWTALDIDKTDVDELDDIIEKLDSRELEI